MVRSRSGIRSVVKAIIDSQGTTATNQIDSANDTYLIVGFNGTLQLTDGQTAEEIMFSQDGGAVDVRRWGRHLASHWQTVSQNAFAVEERP